MVYLIFDPVAKSCLKISRSFWWAMLNFSAIMGLDPVSFNVRVKYATTVIIHIAFLKNTGYIFSITMNANSIKETTDYLFGW